MYRNISQKELAFGYCYLAATIVIVDDYQTQSRGARLPEIIGYTIRISVLAVIEQQRFFIFWVGRERTKHGTTMIC